MKLYLISQTQNLAWDSFDSAVVAAEDEDTARHMNPENGNQMQDKDWNDVFPSWCSSPDDVTVEYLGEADSGIESGVICSSYKAG